MKYLLILFAVTVLFQYSSAQDTLAAKKYEERTIQPYRSHFLVNGKRYEKYELKTLFNQYPVPAAEIKLYHKNETRNDIFSLSSLGLIVASGIIFFSNPEEAERHPALVFTLYGAGLTSSVISGVFRGKARKHFQKALWVYNKEVMVN
jgi:hypothetical protein